MVDRPSTKPAWPIRLNIILANISDRGRFARRSIKYTGRPIQWEEKHKRHDGIFSSVASWKCRDLGLFTWVTLTFLHFDLIRRDSDGCSLFHGKLYHFGLDPVYSPRAATVSVYSTAGLLDDICIGLLGEQIVQIIYINSHFFASKTKVSAIIHILRWSSSWLAPASQTSSYLKSGASTYRRLSGL